MDIYTIGHSVHAWERFSTLLKQHGIRALVDVRSKPVSRWAAFANKRTLPGLLVEEGVKYLYMASYLAVSLPTPPVMMTKAFLITPK